MSPAPSISRNVSQRSSVITSGDGGSLPRAKECSNLLVPVCISASTVAYSSFRMEPNYMIAGHSAGVAAAMAAKTSMSVHKVNLDKLQEHIREESQILATP